MGVRLTLSRAGDDAPVLSELLDGVLTGLTYESDDRPVFPHGLIVLSPRNFEIDQAMSEWRAPRNVLLECGEDDLHDERRLRRLFEIQKQGVRIALRVDQPLATSERLPYFQYLIAPSRQAVPPAIDPASVSIVTLDDSTHERIDADFAAGVHATAGWPLTAVRRREPMGLTPAQSAVFELIRLVQADADVRVLEKVFKAEPLLAYLLLTLANSAGAQAIVAVTRGGATARRLSVLRPRAPIIAVTERQLTARRLALRWGVVPFVMEIGDNLDEASPRIAAALV